MIEITNLCKYYGERRAVGPLSFSIESGEIVGLLGLNGAGKTTTLRILACDLLPSSGTVKVDSHDVVEQPHEVRSQIGYLPDSPPLYSEMTVRDYLAFAARLRKVSASQAPERVNEALRLTHLEHVADDSIASLSHGFKQRVGIAQAIVHQPKLLVLDEPISGLDPVQIVEMRELLRSLRNKHTIIISSHILSEISETCDRILVIRDGNIVAMGSEQELSEKLLERFRVEVTFLGDIEQATQKLLAIDGVTSVEPTNTKEPNAQCLLVEASGDRRAEFARALVSANIDLIGLSQSEKELESVFLQLSGKAEKSVEVTS